MYVDYKYIYYGKTLSDCVKGRESLDKFTIPLKVVMKLVKDTPNIKEFKDENNTLHRFELVVISDDFEKTPGERCDFLFVDNKFVVNNQQNLINRNVTKLIHDNKFSKPVMYINM